MQNLSRSPPPLPIYLLPSLLTPCHLVYASITFLQFPFSPLPTPLPRDLPPVLFLHAPCHFSSTPVYQSNSFAELQGVGEGGLPYIKVTRCSSSRLWCKRSLIQGFQNGKPILFAFKCIAYGFAQIKYQTPDTVCWSVQARATS